MWAVLLFLFVPYIVWLQRSVAFSLSGGQERKWKSWGSKDGMGCSLAGCVSPLLYERDAHRPVHDKVLYLPYLPRHRCRYTKVDREEKEGNRGHLGLSRPFIGVHAVQCSAVQCSGPYQVSKDSKDSKDSLPR